MRDELPKPAHLRHVLFAPQRVDHGARAEEEAGLEPGVREDVKHARRERERAAAQEHVPELRDRGVRENLLDVRLGEAHRGREKRRRAADERDDERGVVREEAADRGMVAQHFDRPLVRDPVEDVAAHHHVDARRHHRRRVDERRYGCRAGHRVREPDVERNLRALAARADEEREADRRHEPACGVPARIGGGEREHPVEVRRAEEREAPEDAEDETEVPDAVDDERLLAGVRGPRLGPVEADEEVRAQPDALPPHEENRQVRAEDEREHREHEEVQVREIPAVPRVVPHVSDRVDVDERADQRDEKQHESRERVDSKRGVEGDRLRAEPRRVLPHRHPRPERRDDALVAVGLAPPRGDGEDRRQERQGARRGSDDGMHARERNLFVVAVPVIVLTVAGAARRVSVPVRALRGVLAAELRVRGEIQKPVHEEPDQGEDRDPRQDGGGFHAAIPSARPRRRGSRTP